MPPGERGVSAEATDSGKGETMKRSGVAGIGGGGGGGESAEHRGFSGCGNRSA